jgi:hypothetical protein
MDYLGPIAKTEDYSWIFYRGDPRSLGNNILVTKLYSRLRESVIYLFECKVSSNASILKINAEQKSKPTAADSYILCLDY